MARKTKRSKQNFQPRFETLEPRQMLSLNSVLESAGIVRLASEPNVSSYTSLVATQVGPGEYQAIITGRRIYQPGFVELPILEPRTPLGPIDIRSLAPISRLPLTIIPITPPFTRITPPFTPITPPFTPITPPTPPPPIQIQPSPVAPSVPVLPQRTDEVTLALYGDGFFQVEDHSGDQLYTRDGRFRLNDANELVTQRGLKVLGYQADIGGNLIENLTPLRIPFDELEVAVETENVFIAGALDPTASVATHGQIISSQVLVTGEFEDPIEAATLLSDVQIRNGQNLTNLLGPLPGSISFTPQKGDRTLETKTLAVTSTSTVQDLMTFIHQASGIESTVSDASGIWVSNGSIQIASNKGIENRLSIGLSSLTYTPTSTGLAQPVFIPFVRTQSATGEGATTQAIVYDSLGIPLTVRITTAIEAKTGSSTIYRWLASSPDNEPITGVGTTIGTGTLTFDSSGNLVPGGGSSIAIQRNMTASRSPVDIALDFDQVNGLANTDNLGQSVSVLNVRSQDGFPSSTLDNYAITETGEIRGVYSSGLVRVIGQVTLAIIPDPLGLREVPHQSYALTPAAGTPTTAIPSSRTGTSLTQLPPDYYVADDGHLTNDPNYRPPGGSTTNSSPWNPNYPWIVRTAHLKIDGRGLFAVEGPRGKTQFTRDGNLHLNIHQQLVTRDGLRVLGYGVDDNFQVDPSQLVPLSVPLGLSTSKASENVIISGTLDPTVSYATQGQIISSQVLVTGEFEDPIDAATLLSNVQIHNGQDFTNLFGPLPGTLSFTPQRGDRTQETKTLAVTSTSTVQDLMTFIHQASGIDSTLSDTSGVWVSNGSIQLASNKGIENRISIGLSSFSYKPDSTTLTRPVFIPFTTTQAAVGEGATTDFIVYDHLGTELLVRISTYLETKDATSTTHRWIATSPDNSPAQGIGTVVGNGLLVFGSDGTLVDGTLAEITIERPGTDPLAVQLDFSRVSTLYQADCLGNSFSALNVVRQDGFPPGALKRFEISPQGEIRGFFTNTMERTLGQVLLAEFSNPWGLRRAGRRLLKATHRSGDPQWVEPGTSNVGELRSLPPTSTHHTQGHRFRSPWHRGPARQRSEAPDALLDSGHWRAFRRLRELTSRTFRHGPARHRR